MRVATIYVEMSETQSLAFHENLGPVPLYNIQGSLGPDQCSITFLERYLS